MNRSKLNKTRGFTLLEVIVAIVIIAGGLIIIASAWSGNTLRLRKSRLYNNVTFLLQRKLAEIETEYKGKPLNEIDDELSGDFGTDYPQYSWKFESSEFEMPDLSAALISQEGGADETLITMIKKTTEFISQSVKEATVTVIVKTKFKSIEFPVTTYFVDYNQDLSL